MKIGRARVICTAQIRAENGNNITKEDEVWCVNMKGDEGWGSRGYMYKRRRQNWQGRGAGQVWKEPKCMPHVCALRTDLTIIIERHRLRRYLACVRTTL
eukprot:scaffold207286_cov26-Tisochrysis_lutea.AAC.1